MNAFFRLLTALLLFSSISPLYGQQADSLLSAYRSYNKADTTRVNQCILLCKAYRDFKIDSALIFASQAYQLSQKLKFKSGEASALNQIGVIYKDKGRQDTALIIMYKSIAIFKSISKKTEEANGYNNIGLIYDDNGEQSNALVAYNKALSISDSIADYDNVGYTYTNIGQCERLHGNYMKALDYYFKALTLYESGKVADVEPFRFSSIYNNIGIVYQKMEKYQDAIEYWHKSLDIKIKTGNVYGAAVTKINLAEVFDIIGELDTAEVYALNALSYFKSTEFNRGIAACLANLGSIEFKKSKLPESLLYFKETYDITHKMEFKEGEAIALNGIAKIYLKQNKTDDAIKSAKQALQIGQENHLLEQEQDANKILSDGFIRKKKFEKGLEYFKAYISIKDSLFNKGKLSRLYNLEKEYLVNQKQVEVDLLEKQNEIKELNLSKERSFRYILIGGLILLMALAGAIYQNYKIKSDLSKELESQNEEIRVQNELIESINKDLHAKALRAQINPHFLFNAINSIQQLVLSGNSQLAYDYFAKFSQLMRKILDHSDKMLVTIEEELESLTLYLEIESLRFDQKFNYLIDVDQELLDEGYKIAPMLIQPFVENAIWHGLLYKEGERKLFIGIHLQSENVAHCSIEDNGIGRDKSKEIKNNDVIMHKSKGIDVTLDRLRLLSNQHGNITDFSITDLKDERGEGTGTKIEFNVGLT